MLIAHQGQVFEIAEPPQEETVREAFKKLMEAREQEERERGQRRKRAERFIWEFFSLSNEVQDDILAELHEAILGNAGNFFTGSGRHWGIAAIAKIFADNGHEQEEYT